jgi:hypothetical protein
MPPRVRTGGGCRGGVLGYPLARLYEEVAFVAYHFHWPHDDVMNMEHEERAKWVTQISAINAKMNETA